MKLSKLKLDPTKEREGVWKEYAPGVEFLVGSAAKPAYRAKAFGSMSKAAARRLGDDSASIELLRAPAAIRAAAEELFLGWRGLEEDDGSPMIYSTDKAEEILGAPEYRDVYDFVIAESNRVANYLAEGISDAGKD